MITKHDAMTRSTFYHATLRNADGTAVRCRANGACKLWKTRPNEFRLPVKYGLRSCFYITPRNAHEWCTEDPTEAERQAKFRANRKANMRKRLGLIDETPDAILHDAMLDAGYDPALAAVVCLDNR